MKILIIKSSAIGDVIQCFNVLEYLKKKMPKCEIDWITSNASHNLISNHPLIRNAICLDFKDRSKSFSFKFCSFFKQLRLRKYDVVFDLQGNCKSGLFTLFSKAKSKVGFAYKSVAEWPNILSSNFQYNVDRKENMRLQYLVLVQQFFNDKNKYFFKKRLLQIDNLQKKQINLIINNSKLQKGLKVLVCPNSKWKNKELSFDILLNFLKNIAGKMDVSFLFLWGEEEEKKRALLLRQYFPENSIIIDKIELTTLQNLINNLDLIIAMDSSILHLCATVDIPSFSIFGPSKGSIYKPIGRNHYALQAKCPYNRVFIKRCKYLRSCISGACLEKLDPETIARIFYKWFRSLI